MSHSLAKGAIDFDVELQVIKRVVRVSPTYLSAVAVSKRSLLAALQAIHPSWPFSTVVLPPFDHGLM
jgi:hypothetical protein